MCELKPTKVKMNNKPHKWLYERDYNKYPDFNTCVYKEAEKYHQLGYRVFIQGYSSGQCKEYKKEVSPVQIPCQH